MPKARTKEIILVTVAALAMGGVIAWAWKAAGVPTTPDPDLWGMYPLPGVWRKFFSAVFPLLFLSFSLWRILSGRNAGGGDPAVRLHRFWDFATCAGLVPILLVMFGWRRVGDWYGWLGGIFVALVILKTGIAAAIETRRIRESGPGEFRPTVGLFVIPALGFAFFGAWLSFSFPTTGDEPHYLLLAHSIANDGDLDLKNNLDAEDFLRFCWVGFPFHYFAAAPGGGVYSMGYNGLFPFILAPGYALLGRLGAVLTVALISAWMAREAALLAFDITRSERAATFSWLLVGLTPPVAYFSGQVYPETLAGLLLLLFLRRWIKDDPRLAWWGAGVMLVLVATKIRFGALSAGVLLLLLAKLRTWPARIAAVALFAGFSAALIWVDRHWLDGFLIYRQSVDAGMSLRKMLPSGESLTAILGFLVDQEFGLIPYSPIYLAGVAGIGWFARRHGRILLVFAVVVSGYFYVLVTYQAALWHAGWSTPARYVTGMAPLLGIVAGAAASSWRPVLDRAVLAAGFLIVVPQVWLLTVRPLYRYNLDTGSAVLLEKVRQLTGSEIARYFPSVVNPTPEGNGVFLLMVIAIVGGGAAMMARSRFEPRQDPPAGKAAHPGGPVIGVTIVTLLSLGLLAVGRIQPTRVLQGESMQADGGSHFSDGQRNVWVLEDSSSLRGEILARGGQTELMIFAGGLSTDGVKPILRIEIDNSTLAEVEVMAGEREWVDGSYKVEADLAAGWRRVRVSLLNGVNGQGVFRGSFVDRVEICGRNCTP
jgi:hypothetical protein